jgi:hypothetical protein
VKETELNWIKPSACESAACAEVAFEDGMVALRNSNTPADVLWFTQEEWEAFTLGAKAGDFNFYGA